LPVIEALLQTSLKQIWLIYEVCHKQKYFACDQETLLVGLHSNFPFAKLARLINFKRESSVACAATSDC